MGWFSKLFGGGEEAKPVVNLPGPGTYHFDIVGESHYQRALERICGGRKEDSQRCEVTATIVHEDDNPYDSRAIRVDIDGSTVGYFNKENSINYRKQMKEAGAEGVTATCNAMIVGGWDRGDGDIGHFGVKLDLPTN